MHNPHTQKSFSSEDVVKAVSEANDAYLDDFTRHIIPQIRYYLAVTLKANDYMAEECAQQALFSLFDRLRTGHFEQDRNVVGYLLVTARNEYFKLVRKENREGGLVLEEQHMTSPAEQYAALVDEEREAILRKCLELLDGTSRNFIEYYLKQPDASYLTVSKLFRISPGLVRVRKSRILHRLHECYQKKSAR